MASSLSHPQERSSPLQRLITLYVRIASVVLLGISTNALASPALELFYTDRYEVVWSDSGSGGQFDAEFYKAVYPSGQGYRELVRFGQAGHERPSGMVVVKELIPGTLASPLDYTYIWDDHDSGAYMDGSFWRPVPPAGYTCLGDVPQSGHGKPALDAVACVRSELVVKARYASANHDGSHFVWNSRDAGRSDFAYTDPFTVFSIKAKKGTGAITIKGAVASLRGFYDDNEFAHQPTEALIGAVYTLKSSAVKTPAVPTYSFANEMIAAFGPEIRLHSEELYMPDDPAVILSHPDTALRWGTTEHKSDNEDGWDNFKFNINGSAYISNSTILEDVQPALSDPLAASDDFVYILDYSKDLIGGDLTRAKAYVRMQPLDGLFVEIQYWLFYPWNGAGKYRVSYGALTEDTFLTTLGRHFSDWESIRVRVSNKNVWGTGAYQPVNLVLSRHSTEEEVSFQNPRLRLNADNHPIVYSARDSHAYYLSPGRHYYARVASEDFVLGTFAVDTFDLTDNGASLHTYLPGKHQFISSAWPELMPPAPNWHYFGGQWGGYERLRSRTTAFGESLQTQYEIGNGKPGLIRRNEWAVTVPENANLGVLRTNQGEFSPFFKQDILDYSMSVANEINEIVILAQAVEHTASIRIHNRRNGFIDDISTGKLLGKQSAPVPLNAGENTIEIIVTANSEPTTKTYILKVTRASYTVSNAQDNGTGSLRDGILSAVSGDTLHIDSSQNGKTIVLSSGELLIDKTIYIDASSLPDGVTVSGNNLSRVFYINSSGELTLKNVTITLGNTASPAGGGGILNAGKLYLYDCRIRNNKALNGGGISTGSRNGNIVIVRSEITGNMATQFGGGIYSNSADGPPLTLSRSAVYGNSAPVGGAMYKDRGGRISLINTTVAENTSSAGGVGTVGIGTSEIHTTYSTVTDGMKSEASLTMVNTIANRIEGTIITSGNNLRDVHLGGLLSGPAPIAESPLRLAPLGDYGGSTKSILPLPNSAANDSAIPNGVPIDQHDAPRGANPDIGAIEASGSLYLPFLSVSDGTLNPVFSPDITSYTLSVAYDIAQLNVVTAKPIDEAEIMVRSGVGAFHDLSTPVNLIVGLNTIEVKVDYFGLFDYIYSIQVTRDPPGNNRDLGWLATSSMGMSPVFEKSVTAYDAGTTRERFLRVWARAEHFAAKVEVRSNSGTYTEIPLIHPVSIGGSNGLIVTEGQDLITTGNTMDGQQFALSAAQTGGIKAVAAGEAHNLVLKNDATILALGANPDGEASVPHGLKRIVGISASNHNLVVTRDGEVVAWGQNPYGQTDVPPGLSNVIAVAAGEWHSLALKSDGTVVGWGDNFFNQVTIPAGLDNVVDIAAGYSHSLALKSDGTVVRWGQEINGGLSNVPTNLSGVVDIAAGSNTSFALKGDGTVVSWGATDNCEQAAYISSLNDVTQISAAYGHRIVLKGNGSVYAWGNNYAGINDIPQGITAPVSATPTVQLVPGLNTVNIRVTAQNGDMKVYIISIIQDDNAPIVDQFEPAPAALSDILDGSKMVYANVTRMGEIVHYRVTGSSGGAFGANIWGSGTYTLDSNISEAAVHAGVLNDGEEGVVSLTIVPALTSYVGSTMNGVTSRSFGPVAIPDPKTAITISSYLGDPFAELKKQYDIQPGITPADLRCYGNETGKTLRFLVLGSAAPDPYNPDSEQAIWYQHSEARYAYDSSLPVAAVHAGILQPGESGIVEVSMEEGFSFISSEEGQDTLLRNGVVPFRRGDNHSSYVAGSYRLSGIAKLDATGNPIVSDNAMLSALSMNGGTLSPIFGPNVGAYTVTRSDNFAQVVAVTPITADAGAAVEVRVNGEPYAPTATGEMSHLLLLSPGANSVDIRVTAENGTDSRVYSLAVFLEVFVEVLDSDDDLIPDDTDNCPLLPNFDQKNTDMDAEGDVCDTDDDNDGVVDLSDTASLLWWQCRDFDVDGCDDCSFGRDGFGPQDDFDVNNDGLDTDKDGQCNLTDIDDDDDGHLDGEDNCSVHPNPSQEDTDGNGIGDICEDVDGLCVPIKTLDNRVSIICL